MGQKKSAQERGTESHFRGLSVGHGKAERVPARGADEGAMQQFHPRFAMAPGFGHEFLDDLAYLKRRGGMGQRLPELDGHRIRNAARPFPKKAAFLETEDAAPNAIQNYRDDGGIDIFHDFFEAAAEGKHLADAGDLAFGEDANEFTIFNRFTGLPQGLNHFARTLFGGNGNDSHDTRQRFDHGP